MSATGTTERAALPRSSLLRSSSAISTPFAEAAVGVAELRELILDLNGAAGDEWNRHRRLRRFGTTSSMKRAIQISSNVVARRSWA